jgi:PAS domain S-box-containing protein
LQQTTSVLRDREQHYRILFDLGPVAVYSCDVSGVIQEFNHRATELWGRTPAQGDTDERFCGSFKLFRPDGSFMPHEQCPMAEVVSGKISDARDAEVLIERPDGKRVTVIVNILPLKNLHGEIIGAINCFYDISQRKHTEEALQRAHDELESLVERRTASLRHLSSRLQNVQDEERRKMARELHDSAGQYLAAVKMNLAQLDHSGLSKEKAAVVAESEELIDKCLGEIRTVSYLLHPPLMDEGGLSSAARFYIDGFVKRSKIKINLVVSPRLGRMAQPVEMVLFRALQESLTNVHRHSGSPNVDIQMDVKNGQVTLAVRDFGHGIALAQLESFEKGNDLGVGLAGMRERVSELGGILQILPEKPGTLVKVTVPTGQRPVGIVSTVEHSDKQGSAA